MLRQAHKVGPTRLAARSGTTRTNHGNRRHDVACGQVQKLPPQVPTATTAWAGESHDFICSWCGEPNPWPRMGGWDRRIKFCDNCVYLMDEIELSATGVFK